ncbi:ATP-dependent helicase [Alistipes sp. ZOR0009]|uniref:ATP-dependent helicase n=1 Tax=Alistipes sp. ZOR0009 TaxID=1339253 RepID=UPI000646A5C9|nr:UvrD-helicase domain-containing protein [Alistipes sp. ZOR0009]
MSKEFLEGLSDVQRQAVENYKGPTLVIAGAGSGKTRVLTFRIANMLADGIHPYSVLALTFTNKAAAEMKERIRTVVGEKAKYLWMGTFHSIFARILRAEADKLGYPSTFTIYDTSDSRSVIKSIVKEMNLDEQVYKVNEVHSRISLAKNNLVTPAVYANTSSLVTMDAANRRPRIADIYKKYMQKCYLSGAMDFDDLLLNTNVLFRDHPDVLTKYQDIFKYILVDEYQDTNMAQYLIVKKLSEQHGNLCVVGDDAQSIYSFRGAKIENILNFRNDYPNYKLFKLEQNYRSTQTIVNAANSIIAKNSKQLKKTSFSAKDVGEKIKVLKAYTDQEEGFLVTGSISDILYNTHCEYKDFAILYRTNAQSRIFEDALRKKNIPYKIYGGLSFYQRKEIKDMVAYLRLIINNNDDEAFKRIVNYPARGIGDTTITRLEEAAAANSTNLWTVVTQAPLDKVGLKGAAIKKLGEFAELVNTLKAAVYTESAYDFALTVATQSGILRDLKEDKTNEGISKFENLEGLLNGIREFEENAKESGEPLPITIDRFLENVALLTDADNEKPEDKNKVSMMTVHSAKGLEFKHIFLVGLEENLFPGQMSTQSQDDLEEERRLFYVAVTRAEITATISYAQTRYKWGNITSCVPSRFVNEIDSSYIDNPDDRWGGAASTSVGSQNSYSIQGFKAKTNTISAQRTVAPPPQHKPAVAITDPADMSEIEVGMEVEHERFGFGKVEKLEGNLPEIKATVNFSMAGSKTLLLKFAKLRIVKR